MPAPIAKGLIISLSLLFAAGAALYENPQVRQWVDQSRRKLAVALHSLGDEIQPNQSRSRSPSEDASTREDESSDAAERRRRAREEILERARIMEERRNARNGQPAQSRSFDDLVDQEGKLKHEKEDNATTTAAEPTVADEGLRKRHAEAKGAALGASVADPFADEMQIDFYNEKQPDIVSIHGQSRESTATLPAALSIEAASQHPSDLLVDLTPTTSTYSAHADLNDPSPQVQEPSTYTSVHEWAQNSTNSFYSPPESVGSDNTPSARAVSEMGSAGHLGNASDYDAVSEMGEVINTPGSWTEVGSVVSEYES